jgi:septum site-determining protein MinC
MDDLTATIRIKGLRDGLLISLPEAPWDEQSTALLSQIDGQPTFFQGARLALDVGPQVIKVNEMVELRDRLSDRGVSLWAVMSESPITEKTAQLLGLATRVSKPRPEELQSLDARNLPEGTALFINRTVRSGTRIEFPGTAVVLGDVNPGAEIVVGGSIIVWGRLRGAAQAGSGGDRDSVVCALDLLPVRLQIAGEVLNVPSDKKADTPAMAIIRGPGIVVEPWQAGGTGQT